MATKIKLSGLAKLVEENKTVELDIETQATILSLAVKINNRGIPYFTKDVAISIKNALIEDELCGSDTILFDKLKTTQADAWYMPRGDWLSLEEVVIESDEDTI